MLIMDEILNWVKDGNYRILVLKNLLIKNMLSSELADKLSIHRASMSRILKDMKDKNLIKSVTSESRTITYSITEVGKKIVEGMEK